MNKSEIESRIANFREATAEERTSVNNYIKSISHKLIKLDVEEIENVLNIREEGKYCKFTDKYLITVTRRQNK